MKVIVRMLLALVLITPVYAEEVLITLLAEDQGNGYVYLVGKMGSFTANIAPNETVAAAMFTLDDTLYPSLTCNGVSVPFESGTFFRTGSYVLTLYDNEGLEGDFAVFSFIVQNDYGDLFSGNLGDMDLETNPKLDMTYDERRGLFVYTLPDGETITSNVPRGGDGVGAATLAISDNMRIVSIHCDGNYVFGDLLSYTTAGNYRIVLRSNEFGNNGTTCYEFVFWFTLGENVIKSAVVNTPEGMTLQSITRNGASVTNFTEEVAILNQDGVYTLDYAVLDTQTIYTRTILRDTTPPSIWFDPPLGDGVVTTELVFTLSDPTAQLELKRHGASVFASRNTIAMDGNYVAEVTDYYGNTRTYTFTVQMARDNYLAYIPLLFGAVVLVGGINLIGRFSRPKVR